MKPFSMLLFDIQLTDPTRTTMLVLRTAYSTLLTQRPLRIGPISQQAQGQGFLRVDRSISPCSTSAGKLHVPMLRSLDAGQSWAPLTQNGYDPFHADCHTIMFYPATPDPGTIPETYFGCDGGLAMSVSLADPSEVFPSSGDASASANNFDTYDPNS